MKIVFMGTPGFAVPSLEKMIENFNVEAIFTQPDKQRGRGKKITFSPVKEVAIKHGVEVFQPTVLRKDEEAIEALKRINPDFIVVVAYGQILNKVVLDIPKYGCINLHASLLPKYRGAAPLNWAIINGEKVSGNTTQLMDIGVDTGDMLIKDEVEIHDDMTVGELHDKLCSSGGDLLVRTLKGIVSGEVKGVKQNDNESSHAPKIDKELQHIKWNQSAQSVKNLIRGLSPYPAAFTKYEDKNIKIYESEVVEGTVSGMPGKIVDVSDQGIKIECSDKFLLIKKIQFPGKKPMYVNDFLRGNDLEKGIILG
ncbi:methionyl-tRNA formyltransferase [Oceanirhabdus sp. W0125-5]|uniref:methionyl-tRNA formyltransferase n=1 Tax=Oceanirhabdus sp. W0125-5 TaxID=2999116 RepID=UPI0022F2C941|nr:methionyl-tRNA formyltransferase [Oceanirhabdus sp. W0125-5]WBW94781.1 methionyl-tRNA formyltransferase [Oceanirhabdus sp. W0125-5]